MGQAIGTSSVAAEPAVSGSNSVAGGTAGQFNGNVFIQGGNLLVEGTATATGASIGGVSSSGGAGVEGVSTTSQGFGVSGINNAASPCIAVNGSSTKGHGVKGANGAGSGITVAPAGCGVWGDSKDGIGVFGTSNGHHGVYGESTNSSGFGVSGLNNSAWPCIAVLGSSENGHGVKGVNVGVSGKGSGTTPTAGCGVWGDSDQGFGIFGASATQYGVFGTSAHSDGVHGINGEGSGTTLKVGCGVYGESAAGYGVYGASKRGKAGVFDGSVEVNGDHHVTGAGQFDGAVKVKLDLNIGGNHNVTGNVNVVGDLVLTNPGADCAEQFDLNPSEIADPGTVMVIDDTGALRRSSRSYDRAVAGVVSGAGAYRPAIVLDQLPSSKSRTTIALLGKVYCKVDANICSIAAGDLLTTSDIPGHAMKVTDFSRGFGAVIGKALAPLQSGTGLLPMLIALR